jgi:hypothetical protein
VSSGGRTGTLERSYLQRTLSSAEDRIMPKHTTDDLKRNVNRCESAVRALESELEDMRFRLAALEAWILDKEHAGLTVKTMIQNVGTEKFLDRTGQWVTEPESAYDLTSALNALHHCRKERMHNVRLMLEVQRASGVAVIPVDLPGLRN